MSKVHKPPISLSRIKKHIGSNELKGPVVVVGPVTDDNRLTEVPKNVTVACLKITRTARARLEKNGGTVLTLDQLAMRYPTGSNCLLLRGPKSREALSKPTNHEQFWVMILTLCHCIKRLSSSTFFVLNLIIEHFFGVAGRKHVKPYVQRHHGKKTSQIARGRRASRGYKKK